MNEHVDVLVTDLIMPECSGQQLVAILKQKLPDLRIMLISGNDDLLHTASHDLQVDASLSKPFTPTALVSNLQTLLAPPR